MSLYGDHDANDSVSDVAGPTKTDSIEMCVQTDDDEREHKLLQIIVQLTEKVAIQTLTLSEQQLMMDKLLDEHESERVNLQTRSQQFLQAVVGLTEKVAVQQTTLDERNSTVLQQARSIENKICLETSLRHSLSSKEKTIQELRESDQKYLMEQSRLQIALQESSARENASHEKVKKIESSLAMMNEAMSAL